MLGRLLLLSQSDVAVNMLPMCRLFAEDNSLQYSQNNILDIEHYLNHYLKILESWSKKWFLKFNPTKTKDVFFTKKHNSVLSKLFFEGYIMEFVLTHRHLGLNMGILLDYSFDIIPSKRKIISQYNIRNKDKFIVPKILD